MSCSPQKTREILFHLLYTIDFVPNELDELFLTLMKYHKVPKKVLFLLYQEAEQIFSHLAEIDALIQEVSIEYSLKRIPSVERNLLRLAVYEICFSEKTPPKVAISEAMRLSRKFSTPESSHFVNAILDSLYKKEKLRCEI